MNFPDYFPIWDQLNQDQQDRLQNSAALRSAPRGTVLHNGVSSRTRGGRSPSTACLTGICASFPPPA